MLELARNAGAEANASAASVSLTQKGKMRNGPDDPFMSFKARQTISMARPEFLWRASTGPWGSIKVEDGLKQGQGRLRVSLFGLLSVADMGGGALMAKGETMRYLAELAWAPDALLANKSLVWNVRGPGKLVVGAGYGEARGEVQLQLSADGLIATVSGLRPRVEGKDVVERLWQGQFSDYRLHEGRRIPFHAEVGWQVDKRSFIVWRGDLTSWKLT